MTRWDYAVIVVLNHFNNAIYTTIFCYAVPAECEEGPA
jgi:hypothetical protein